MEEKGIIIVLGVVILFAALFAAALNTGYIQSQAVLQDGSTPLTGDWDAGNYTITSDSLTLTGPFGGWEKRIKLSIDSGDVDSTLSNFPVLVYLSTSSGISSDDVSAVFDEVGANYNAIRFTSDDEETNLYYEVELWNETGEEAWIWVKVPSVSNTADTDLYLYYDSTRDGSIYNSPEDVWDNDFVMVQHMTDETTSTILDSTKYDNDGIKKGVNEPIETTNGQIDSAQDFDGSDDYINILPINDFTSLTTGTIEAWINPSLLTSVMPFFEVGDKDVDNDYASLMIRGDQANDPFEWLIKEGGVETVRARKTSIFSVETWQHIVFTVNSSGNAFYIDGSYTSLTYTTGNSASSNFFADLSAPDLVRIGSDASVYDGFFSGVIDENKISNVSRSASWIKATYESGKDDLIEFDVEKVISILQVDRISEYTDDYGVYIDGVLIKDSDITIALANYLYFRDTEVYIASIDDGHLDLEADTSIDLNSDVVITGGVIVGGNIDMQHNYIIESDFSHWLDFTVEGGKTDETLNLIPAGVCVQDRHYHRLTIGVNTAPGSGKFFNMTLTDGTNELTVSLTNSETSTWTTTGEFDWDASAETLTLHYSQTAGGATTNAFVTIKYHYKENE